MSDVAAISERINDSAPSLAEKFGLDAETGQFAVSCSVALFLREESPPFREVEVVSYVKRLHDAAAPFVGIGKLRLSASLPKRNSRAKFSHFNIGDKEGMVAAIKALVKDDKGKDTGKNVSLPWFVVHGDAPLAALKETDILAALAIVTDPKSIKGDKYRMNEHGIEPSAVLRIGHQQFRNIYLFDRPVPRNHDPALYKYVSDASIDSPVAGTLYHSKDSDTVKALTPMAVVVVMPFGDVRFDVDGLAQKLPSAEPGDVNLKPPTNYPPSEEYSELGNAKRLVRRFGYDIRYVWPLKAWFIFDGNHWRRDDGSKILQLAQATVEALFNEAQAVAEEATRTAMRKFALSCQTRKHLQAVAGLVQQFPEIVLPIEALDANPLLVGVLNGTVDLRSGEHMPGRREDYITKCCNVIFDPSTKCPNWLEFQKKITGDDQDLTSYKQRVFGLLLSAEVPEILFIAHGDGANGKTTELETLHRILGSYAHACDASLLISPRDQTGPTPEIVALLGKRAVFINETNAKDWLNEARVKYLAGSDTLYGRGLHQDPVNFKPTHKPFLRTNHKPKIRGTDLGIWRRIHYIPYNVTISDSETITNFREERLLPEHAGIFNWLLQGWLAYVKDGRKLKPPQRVQEAQQAYKESMDHTRRWVRLATEWTDGNKMKLTELHEAYTAWYGAEVGEVGAVSSQTLSSALQAKRDGHEGFAKKTIHGYTVFENIQLKAKKSPATPSLPRGCEMNPWVGCECEMNS